jgi:flagellar basal body rod protein FlgG
MIADAVAAALGGMQRNQDAFARHAHRIANAGAASTSGASGVDLQEELVGVLVARRAWEANLPVLRAADEMLGSLLDVLA